ncbi:MAG: hypothetical protein KC983_01985, partial [Phycisphaerales bacterium]|nr:hypothetical protein [Phycisphaerales bacterium]
MSETSYDKSKMNVLLLEGVHANAEARFRDAGYSHITAIPHAMEPAELRQHVASAHLVGIRSRTQLTADIIDAAERLIGIGCFCIGTNQVDLTACEKRGIPVFNAPFSNTRSVAELVTG